MMLHVRLLAFCLVPGIILAQQTEIEPKTACPTLMQLSHATPVPASCVSDAATRDAISPLHEGCIKFSTSCGIHWNYSTSWPCFLNTWASMKEGFTNCCLSGGHEDSTCKSLANEAFSKHMNTTFPEAAAPDSPAFCTEIEYLRKTHFAWHLDSASSVLVEANRGNLLQTIAHRIVAARDLAPKMYEHFAAGALVLATGLNRHSAAVAVVASALSTHLEGCDPNAR